MNPSSYWSVPEWLVEAWETGQSFRFRQRQDLIQEILKVRTKVLKNKELYDSLRETGAFSPDDADRERMSFNLWYLNALMAKLGWMEIRQSLDQK